MRILPVVVALGCIAAAAPAQQGYQPPAMKLLVLPLMAKTPTDSAMSIAVMDVARDKLGQMARSKAQVIAKPKLCEALKASDYPCDVLLDETQANQLARFLTVNAYTTGTVERSNGALGATIRVRDIGSSGMAALVSVSSPNPGTAAALGEGIATRLNNVVKAAEQARECTDARQKSQFPKALDAARKALVIEPNLPAAHMCIATVYEAQHMSLDSQLVAYQRAVKGDSLNATAWENIAHLYQQKGDTLKAIDALTHELGGEPQNIQLRLGIAELLRQQRQYERAKALLEDWLSRNQADERAGSFLLRICIEGGLYRCELDIFAKQFATDTAKGADSAFLKATIGAAQQVADTQQLLVFAHVAVRHFPKSAIFWKTLGAAFDLKGQRDSSLWAYKQSLAIDPNDISNTLLVAKAIVDGTVYDTAQANKLKGDTAQLRVFRTGFADRVDSAKVFLDRALASSDSTQRLNAMVIMLTGASKIAQAGAYDRAYPWLDQLLTAAAPKTPADTVGPRQQIRIQASFWYGLASLQTLGVPYSAMTKSKNCEQAKGINERIKRTKDAMDLGMRVAPDFVRKLQEGIAKYQEAMLKVKQAFKCKNF
ncbi:MAG TPA: tetratricopeptide repeat protein [Gemmatimonadales bacterium]|nr:tetratricopeptide repeat protein [Gemmatimonadales bacterium]